MESQKLEKKNPENYFCEKKLLYYEMTMICYII